MTKEEKAVHLLDMFTKTWCRKDATGDKPEFECFNCEFHRRDGFCAVKLFKNHKYKDYENFGSMVH